MVLILTPALDGLKREWREAARDPRREQLAVLALCRAAGPVAEPPRHARSCSSPTPSARSPPPIALTGSLAQHRHHPALRADPRRRAAQPESRLCAGARHDRHHRALQRRLHLAARAQRAVAAMKRARASAPGSPSRIGAIYFLVPLIAHLRVLAAHAARRVQLRCLPGRASPTRSFQATFGYSTVHRAR